MLNFSQQAQKKTLDGQKATQKPFKACSYGEGTPRYNRMKFTDNHGREFYFSYSTLIGFRANPYADIVVRVNDFSTTTGRHLNFLEPDHKKRLSETAFNEALELFLAGGEK